MTKRELIQALKDLPRSTAYVAADGCKCCESYVAYEDDSLGDVVQSGEIDALIFELEYEPQLIMTEDDGSEEKE